MIRTEKIYYSPVDKTNYIACIEHNNDNWNGWIEQRPKITAEAETKKALLKTLEIELYSDLLNDPNRVVLDTAEVQLQKKYKVHDNFLYYLGNNRTLKEKKEKDIKVTEEEKKKLAKINGLTLKEALETDHLNDEQKQILENGIKRTMVEVQTESEKRQEELTEHYTESKYFREQIEHHLSTTE